MILRRQYRAYDGSLTLYIVKNMSLPVKRLTKIKHVTTYAFNQYPIIGIHNSAITPFGRTMLPIVIDSLDRRLSFGGLSAPHNILNGYYDRIRFPNIFQITTQILPIVFDRSVNRNLLMFHWRRHIKNLKPSTDTFIFKFSSDQLNAFSICFR